VPCGVAHSSDFDENINARFMLAISPKMLPVRLASLPRI